jgi:putative FmdB family regulatory protein
MLEGTLAMPLYEYECTQCHRHTEKIQKFSDAEITICPHCGGGLERVISAPAIAFKGGGWFKDGYGNAKPSAPSGEGKSDASAPASSPVDSTGSGGKQKTASSSSGWEAAVPSAPAAPASSAPSSDKK